MRLFLFLYLFLQVFSEARSKLRAKEENAEEEEEDDLMQVKRFNHDLDNTPAAKVNTMIFFITHS